MTPPIDDPDTLRRILANTDALFLDFDGPICSVFAGFPAPIVAQQLRDILAEGGHTHLPDEIATATDPFDILFYAATLGEEEARYVEAAFTAHEVEAIQTAQPTPDAHELIHTWKSKTRRLAIISNNSQDAVETYLDIHHLRSKIDYIAARKGSNISQLKPSPDLVVQAITAFSVQPDRCVFVGDSLADIQAALVANVPVIGYANKPGKVGQFATTRADLLISRIWVVRAALLANRSK